MRRDSGDAGQVGGDASLVTANQAGVAIGPVRSGIGK